MQVVTFTEREAQVLKRCIYEGKGYRKTAKEISILLGESISIERVKQLKKQVLVKLGRIA